MQNWPCEHHHTLQRAHGTRVQPRLQPRIPNSTFGTEFKTGPTLIRCIQLDAAVRPRGGGGLPGLLRRRHHPWVHKGVFLSPAPHGLGHPGFPRAVQSGCPHFLREGDDTFWDQRAFRISPGGYERRAAGGHQSRSNDGQPPSHRRLKSSPSVVSWPEQPLSFSFFLWTDCIHLHQTLCSIGPSAPLRSAPASA